MSVFITQDMVTQAVNDVVAKLGKLNLEELARVLHISRQRVRTLKKKGFKVTEHGNCGEKGSRKLAPFLEVINEDFLKKGTTNSEVICTFITKLGYDGGLTIIKDYVRNHRDLVPAPRVLAVESTNRGVRYYGGVGEMFQMDWGFVKVIDDGGNEWQCACFAMVCHHCGLRHVEFFKSARQENLFIGMIHSFAVMGVPEKVLTDNMKSVVTKRDAEGNPVWNTEYEAFQSLIGFKTVLCKVAHPFTKGGVERLVRYVKGNFIQGRTFTNITDLNVQAAEWCYEKNSKSTRYSDFIPMEEHYKNEKFSSLPPKELLIPYLAPLRKISYDGFVNYEDRRYGVPIRFAGREIRVMREKEQLFLIAPDTNEVVYTHTVDWSRKAKVCVGQWSAIPEEHPTQKVTSYMRQVCIQSKDGRFSRFSLMGKEEEDDER